jgi:putative ABC transport system permease protein
VKEAGEQSAASKVRRSRLRVADVLGVGSVGLRTRKLRTTLTATGIAIGIAALVAVLGISDSSRADLLAELDALGTNRLEVRAGTSFTGEAPALADEAVAMIRRIGPVEQASGITTVDATVRRTEFVDEGETNGISVQATDPGLAGAVGATLADGRFLDEATVTLPTIVLGASAATSLGLPDAAGSPLLYVSGTWFSVVGILEPIPLYPSLDGAAFIGTDIAVDRFDTELAPSTVYVVTDQDRVEQVREVLPATADPDSPGEVDVSRPSDAIAARQAADETLTSLLLGLGAVALLVGGIGIANVMVIAVLERRTEIGVRRALGATKRHVGLQFLVEAVLLSALGGVLGVVIGVAVTAGYAAVQDIVLSVPASVIAAGAGAALVVGALAGLSPAARAARLAPADAIRPA